MLSSSLPATLNHWKSKIIDNENFDEGEDLIEDFDLEEEEKPLTSRLQNFHAKLGI